MHSRVIQLEENFAFDDLDIADLEESWFVGSVADYVAEVEYKEQEIEWFLKCLPDTHIEYDQDKQTLVFLPGFKEEYFRDRFDMVKDLVANMTLDAFANDVDFVAYKTKVAIEDEFCFFLWQNGCVNKFDDFVRSYLQEGRTYYDEFGFYLWQNGCVNKFDDFVRSYLQEGRTYYLGGILDYHY